MSTELNAASRLRSQTSVLAALPDRKAIRRALGNGATTLERGHYYFGTSLAPDAAEAAMAKLGVKNFKLVPTKKGLEVQVPYM